MRIEGIDRDISELEFAWVNGDKQEKAILGMSFIVDLLDAAEHNMVKVDMADGSKRIIQIVKEEDEAE